MAATPTTYKNEVQYIEGSATFTDDVYADTHYAGEDVYADKAITRSRTRYTNENRFKDEEIS